MLVCPGYVTCGLRPVGGLRPEWRHVASRCAAIPFTLFLFGMSIRCGVWWDEIYKVEIFVVACRSGNSKEIEKEKERICRRSLRESQIETDCWRNVSFHVVFTIEIDDGQVDRIDQLLCTTYQLWTHTFPSPMKTRPPTTMMPPVHACSWEK